MLPPPLQDAHILPDGKILLCGQFTSYNGVPARGLVRLLPNGVVDDTFTIGDGPQWTETIETPSFFPFVEAIEEQVDGKLLIAGTFEAFNGTTLPGIASLNPDGSVDPSFTHRRSDKSSPAAQPGWHGNRMDRSYLAAPIVFRTKANPPSSTSTASAASL